MKKIDLHTHTVSTPSDSDFEFSLSKVSEYVSRLEIDALAITNHNIFDKDQYNRIRNELDIPVFPGIEIDLEGGHLLVITDHNDFEVAEFDERCKEVSRIIISNTDELTLHEFNTIFPDLTKYLLIPHSDKKPIIKKEIIQALSPHIAAGEVASVSKFKRAFKEVDGLVPVLFSDIRFSAQIAEFPTRHTYVDLDEISLAGLKSCLFDKSKISLTRDGGNDFFQSTDEGLMLSTGLNIILGGRSSGKTYTLEKIAGSSGNAKYIKQFSLLQNDEQKFNETNKARLSLLSQDYISEFRKVVEDVVSVDLKQNHIDLENYLDSLKRFASENEKKDLYSKCTLFNEAAYTANDLTNLKRLIESVNNLIENNEYRDVIEKHVTLDSLKSLSVELMELATTSTIENSKSTWLNALLSDIQRELRIKTTGSYVEELDFFKIAMDEVKVKKFEKVARDIKHGREINRKELSKYSIITTTHPIEGAMDLARIGRDKKSYSVAFNHHYDDPYTYLLKLKELDVEDANLCNFFIKVESVTHNKDGFPVSGGERSEFNLIYEIQDATKYDMLLIDEPESSFDNLFLKTEINSIIKHISTLMPVVVVTHNSTVGASIKPNYVAVTQKSIENGEPVYRIFTGYPSDKELTDSEGTKLKNYDALLNCLEAGEEAYAERKEHTYEILKD